MMQTILNSFEVWSDAQGIKSRLRIKSIENISLEGIARLRELILELAIRGKLAEQDPNDESASIQLKNIKKEKEKLLKEGTIRKIHEPLEFINADFSYTIPPNWIWCRLQDLVSILGDGIHGTPKYDENGEYYFINGNNLKDGKIEIKPETKRISKEEFIKSKRTLNKNTILVSINGTIGNTAFYNDENIILGKSACYFNLLSKVDKNYLQLLLKTNYFLNYAISEATGTTIKNVSLKTMRLFMVPLPPYKEQFRIVAKVNELMALCDDLEKQKTNHLKTHQHLVKCLLETLSHSANADELHSAWQRLAPHFDDLFCTEDSIEQLKQSILQLAVMGKLVKQDAKDEGAKIFLNKLLEEKKIIEKTIALKTFENTDNCPFQIPNTWEWTYLENVSSDIHYGFNASADEFNKEIRMLRITDIQDDLVNWNTVPGCEINKNQIQKYLLENGDILIARTGGTIGKSYLVSDLNLKSVFASYLIRVKKLQSSYSDFVKIFLKSECYWTQLHASSMGTGQPNVNGTALKKLLIPIPPLAEQKRIVAKVEELFALCDALKSKLQKAQAIQNTLAETVVAGVSVRANAETGKTKALKSDKKIKEEMTT